MLFYFILFLLFYICGQ